MPDGSLFQTSLVPASMLKPEEVTEGARRKLTSLERRYGDTIRMYRGKPGVTDIHRNADGRIWLEQYGEETNTGAFMSEEDARRIIQLVADIDKQPIADGEVNANLPTGERFSALIPAKGKCSFSIRQPFGKSIMIQDYQDRGILSDPHAEAIRMAVRDGLSILVIGATGAGKTTLANAIMAEPPYPSRRVFIIQDQNELQFQGLNVVYGFIGNLSDQKLVKHSLRRKPEAIIYGELRDRIGLDYVKAVRSGHKGLSTIHADDGIGGLSRLEFFLVEAGVDPIVSRQYVVDAVDLVVVIKEVIDRQTMVKKRIVTEVALVKKELSEQGRYQLDQF